MFTLKTPFDIVCIPSRHPSAVIRTREVPEDVQAFKENLLLFYRARTKPKRQ